MARAIILGSSGQDGTILFQKLQLAGFEVLGVTRDKIRSSMNEFADRRVSISSREDVFELVRDFQPDQIYHLAAYQHSSSDDVGDEECDILSQSLEINVLALHHVLEAVHLYSPNSAVFYAGSSHVFGKTSTVIQTEETPFSPIGYYGISKVAGIELCRYYRDKRSLSVATGILYNHESVYRKPNFVSVKIIRGALDILHKKKTDLVLGDLAAKVDWGSAHDYVDAMYLLLSKRISDDFIIATGVQHSVREFVEIVFNYLGLDFRDYVKESKGLINRSPNSLCGDISKIQDVIGWSPETTFKEMVLDMTNHYQNQMHVGG